MLDRHHQPFCVGAIAADAELAAGAPDLLAEQVGRALDHGAGIVAAGRARPDGVGHGAQNGLDVGGVDPGAGHPDQGLADLGTARSALEAEAEMVDVRRLGGDADRAHGWILLGDGLQAAGGRGVAGRLRRARVSAAVATVPPRSSTSWRARSTSAALDGASLPRAR